MNHASMESNPYFNYLFFALFFIIAISFSILINFLILRFSKNLGMRDVTSTSNLVRWGSTTKPSLGGFSFYMIFLISVSVLGVTGAEASGGFNKQLIGLMAASSLGFLIGLADDAYNTNPLVKFIGQLTCATLLVLTDFIIPVTPIGELNAIFTIVWIIGLMNSINMLDNMDAITSSVSISVLLGGMVLILLNGAFESLYLIIILGAIGALVGFLFFNWHPSKMYMGDTGSQFLGVLLAAVSILFFWNFRNPAAGFIEIRQFLIPMLLFIIPLIDTTTVVIRRLMRRQSPFVGGKDHITHHLAYLGLPDQWVAIVLGTVSLFSIYLTVLIYQNFPSWKPIYDAYAIGYFIGMFILFQVLYNLGQSRHRARQKALGK
ncbi:MAG: MraY family glycosyltransferase [Chitinophagales bacterium]|nr:MraY family glycosyltransferase [Chitinophagales bacterium]